MRGTIRTKLINIALNIYNAAIFAAVNFLMWRNHVWNTEKWTSADFPSECPKKIGAKNAPVTESA